MAAMVAASIAIAGCGAALAEAPHPLGQSSIPGGLLVWHVPRRGYLSLLHDLAHPGEHGLHLRRIEPLL